MAKIDWNNLTKDERREYMVYQMAPAYSSQGWNLPEGYGLCHVCDTPARYGLCSRCIERHSQLIAKLEGETDEPS